MHKPRGHWVRVGLKMGIFLVAHGASHSIECPPPPGTGADPGILRTGGRTKSKVTPHPAKKSPRTMHPANESHPIQRRLKKTPMYKTIRDWCFECLGSFNACSFYSSSLFLKFLSPAMLCLYLKGCGMGTLFVLVSPCFRENVVVTCRIGSFLHSLDNLLQKNIIIFFFFFQISKWRSFEKGAIFDLLTFFSPQGKVTKIPSAHISLTYIHVFCSPYWLFLPYQCWKKYEFIRYDLSLVWVLVLILIRTILEQSINNKMVSKILSWNVYYWYVFIPMPNL